MRAIDVARRYFDAWNRRDAAGVAAMFAGGGTYRDPATTSTLRGEAIAGYVRGLVAAFPDLSFEEAMDEFFGPDFAAGGVTGVWVPHRLNTMWVRCESCHRMMSAARATCQCGKPLPPHPPTGNDPGL